MKLGIAKVMVAAVAALVVASAAFSQTVNIRAQVPFRFAVSNQTYPAGEYAVKTLVSHSNLTYVANRNAEQSAMTITHPVDSGTPAKNSVLLFHRIGNTYFLYQVWAEGSRMGLEFRQTPREKELLASGTKPETISVAAEITQ